MSLSESKRYNVVIILGTESGELPTDNEVKELIIIQMAGELDEETGLFCIDVEMVDENG